MSSDLVARHSRYILTDKVKPLTSQGVRQYVYLVP